MSSRPIFIASIAFLLMTTPVMAVTTVNELRAENAASREAVKETIKENRAEVRTAVKERWEELKNSREAKREEIKTKVKEMREDVKAKVTAMRDAKKKQVVERVQENFGNVNKRRTEHFQIVLDRLSTVLDKIVSRTEKAKAEGKNVTNIETAITTARTAITTAESAINVQKEKIYQVTVTDDTTARNEVGAVVKQLESDLQAVQRTVQAARDAVQKVFGEIKIVASSGGTATPSATGSSVTQ